MALPDQLNPTVPPDVGEAVSLGPSRIRAIASVIADFFGVPIAPSTLTGQATSFTSGGVMNITQPGATVAANPTTPLGIATKQYVDQSVWRFNATLGGDNYTITNTIPITSLTAGTIIYAIFQSSNVGTTPTLNVDGTGAYPIYLWGVFRPYVGALQPTNVYPLVFNAGISAWQMITTNATGLLNAPILTAPTTNGQVLAWNTNQWAPTILGAPSQYGAFTGTLVNSSIGAASNATLYTLTTNAPSNASFPGSKWRAVISFSVNWNPHTNASNGAFTAVLSEANVAGFLSGNNAAGGFSTLSAHTVTSAATIYSTPSVATGTTIALTVTGYAPQAAIDVATTPDAGAGGAASSGGISVAWIQAS